MNRRNLLKSAASVATGAGLLAARPGRRLGRNGPKSATSNGRLLPFIETRDRTTLFYKDWGPKESEKANPSCSSTAGV